MLGSIPHQKFCFYHLPTQGREGIKLGDAWYVSNVSIICNYYERGTISPPLYVSNTIKLQETVYTMCAWIVLLWHADA